MNASHIKKLAAKGIGYESDSGLLRLTETAAFARSNTGVISVKSKDNFELLENSSTSQVTGPIYPVLRAMTSDKITGNSTFYPASELMGDEFTGTGIHSWIHPYPRPVIMDHNESGGMFGGPASPVLGRIKAAGIVDGENYLSLVAEISDPDAITKVLDGRYMTCSIGVSAESCKCSICGVDQREEWCDHVKGITYQIKQQNGSYKEQLCHYIIGGIRAREISFVNVPSDDEAMVIIKDLGKEGMKDWASKTGVISRTESVEQVPMDLQNALKGCWFVESKQKENNNMAKTQETTDSNAVENPTAEATETQLTEFKTVSDILTEAAALNALKESGETLDETRVANLSTAVETAGFSESHKLRVVLGELEGTPALSNELDLEALSTESEDESTKSIIEKVKNSDSQVDLTVNESLLLLEELSKSLVSKNKSLEESNTALASKLKEAEDRLVELQETELGETKTLLESALETGTKLAESYKSILIRFTATESIRAKRAFAKNRSMDEVVELLSTRTESSLLDTLNDLLAENSATTQTPIVEPVANPVSGQRAEEDSSLARVGNLTTLLKKLQTKSEASDTNTTQQEVQVGNQLVDIKVEESSDDDIVEVSFENGFMVFKPKNAEN